MAPCSRLRKIFRRKKDGRAPPTETPNTHPVSVPPQLATTTTAPLSAEQNSQPSPSAPAPAPLQSPDADPSGRDIDLWTRAFEKFDKTELAEDYRKHLSSLQGDNETTNVNILTPHYAQQVVQKLLEDREQRQWRVSLLGKDIAIREQTERLAKFLLWSDPIVQKALSSQPYAALAWSGVSILLPLLASSTTQNKAMLDGLNSISEMQVYWNICEEKYLRSPDCQQYEALVEPLVELYAVVIGYQARVICHLSKEQLSRAWANVTAGNDWAGEAETVKTKSNMCKALIPPLTDGTIHEHWRIQMDEMQQSRQILNEIRQAFDEARTQTQKVCTDQRETSLLHDLASNYEGYKNFNPERVEGTCEWFFADDRFHEWRDSSMSRLLWVTADPGCGKSVLSRALIDEGRLSTQVSTSTVCHFFFKDGNEGQMRSPNALSAVLHQLFARDLTGRLIQQALHSHKNFGSGLAQNFSELWKILMQCAKDPDAGQIICILDALDECEQSTRYELIDALEKLYSQQPSRSESFRVKFLITSRPYDDLEERFAQFSAAKYMRFDSDDKSPEIAREINLVIDTRVREITRTLSDDDRHRIADRLKKMENRTYLWLYLIIDTIKMTLSRFKKSSNIERLLSDIPAKVSEAYEKILSRNQDEAETEMLLRVVLAAARPLTLDEASFALSSAVSKNAGSDTGLLLSLWPKDGFKSTVKNLCGLFISVHDSKLSFIHQTAREFLTNPKRHGTWEGRFSVPRAHSTMSSVCLDYLLLPDLATATLEAEFLFIPYAAHHWALHFMSQEAPCALQATHAARRLCDMSQEHTNRWTRAVRLEVDSPLTDLSLASRLGLKPIVELILSEGVTEAKHFNTALQAASRCGQVGVIDLLLQSGANIDAIGGYFGTALQVASRFGHIEVVSLLLERGAGVNVRSGEFGMALHAAAHTGETEVVSLLLRNGADVNAKGGRSGTALQLAAYNGHVKVVSLLLENGANVNAESGVNGTALQAASVYAHSEIVRMLLQNGADVNAKGYFPSALHVAKTRGHGEIAEILLSHGATPC